MVQTLLKMLMYHKTRSELEGDRKCSEKNREIVSFVGLRRGNGYGLVIEAFFFRFCLTSKQFSPSTVH